MPDNQALFSAKNLHPEWLLAWEFSIKDQSLREELLGNPRVNHRIIDNIANANKLTPIRPEYITGDIEHICQVLANDLEQFVDICGLALMGTALRQLISPSQLALYVEKFDPHILKKAMQANISHSSYATLNFETTHLNEVVRKAGYRTIAGWTWGLDPSIGGRIRMMLPAVFSSLSDITETIDPATAAQTVKAVANLLAPQNTVQQAA